MSGLSDYELLDLFNEYFNASGYHFMNFLTVYFAFLVTTYLIGRKLTPSMIMTLIGLYTAFTMLPATATFVDWHLIRAIAEELSTRGPGVTEHARFAIELATGLSGSLFMFTAAGLQLLAYVAGLLFLREVRKQDTSKGDG